MKRHAAFTLTELLVVIAGGAVAGAVLLASLGDAKERVRAAACMSNLREISFAIRLYTDDHNGLMPTASTDNVTWPKRLRLYLPLRGPNPTSTPHRVFVCPNANYPGYENKDLGLTYSCTSAMLGPQLGGGSGLTAQQPRKESSILTPPWETPLIIEGKEDVTGSTPSSRSNYPWTTYAHLDLIQTNAASCLFLDFRHNEIMNIAYVDGSVRAVTFTQAKSTFTKSLWEGR